ncbi:uncharacterized protein Z518_06835 [Rhinocladiella mackenziei CBS 650.93]|uniref:Rhinocladiella mackenziei CBS 650.93 unplaced genomic scaffold supercont1.5, whole genome shotgun sequence n=1 Tax=Rhinocladiella mackenziei CBS 650.93 TaxID=1442369 RepID=A0A0D2GYK3_9EURO|nr:uncharacterized protein Z518_06835 [Rhinocladiella mackenziei CBS 650.93]KIX03283.1 hypothetical protein Z518_06835 [Rhinocladiella mackenziei CBS 650.93]
MSRGYSWGGARGARGTRGSIRASRGFPDRAVTSWKQEEQPLLDPPAPFGELLLEMLPEDISNSSYEPKITDCRYVASYTWLDGGPPSILIPGRPPAWAPPATDRQLEPDKGHFFRDPNAARYPSYPMQPAVQAVLGFNERFPTHDMDIFTCASALGNLSRFVRGMDREFRIIVARVGKTVFFIRRENSPSELIPNVRGYGHTFPEEYTTWDQDVKKAGSHQRVIQYNFGGLRLLVRFEADGHFRQSDSDAAKVLSPQPEPEPEGEGVSLVEAFGSASLGHAVATPTDQKCLHIKHGGEPISQEDIFDIKTRSAFDHKTGTIKREIDMTDITPRLWVSQIPTLIVGFHERGLFKDIRIQDMREEVSQWEDDNSQQLRQLASLLHEILEFSRTSVTSLELCRSESGPLQIRRLADEGLDVLPEDWKSKWIGESDDANGEDEDVHGSPRSIEDRRNPDLWDDDDDAEKDYTACSAEHCGYCGHCRY